MRKEPQDPRKHLGPAEAPLPQAQVNVPPIQGEEVAPAAGAG